MRVPVHSTLRTNKRKKQTTEHSLVQPPIQQKHQHQYRTQIPCPSRLALPERPQTQKNI